MVSQLVVNLLATSVDARQGRVQLLRGREGVPWRPGGPSEIQRDRCRRAAIWYHLLPTSEKIGLISAVVHK
jgi:hypothetical protein